MVIFELSSCLFISSPTDSVIEGVHHQDVHVLMVPVDVFSHAGSVSHQTPRLDGFYSGVEVCEFCLERLSEKNKVLV